MRENFFTQVTKRKMKKIEDMKLIKKIKKPEKLKIKAREKLSTNHKFFCDYVL